MLFNIIISAFSILFLTLSTSANAAFKTRNNSAVTIIKFAFFMAVSYFCFYYIGAFISKYLVNITPQPMWMMISALFFLTIAVKTVWNVFSYKAEDNMYDLSKTSIHIFLSILGGINALLLGVALNFSRVLILNSALIIAMGAFMGAMCGARLSSKTAQKVTRLRPALLGAIGFLSLAIRCFLKFYQ